MAAMSHFRTQNRRYIHCSGTPNGKSLAVRDSRGVLIQNDVEVIDGWHKARGFKRDEQWRARFNPHLEAIGYHYAIEPRGGVYSCRHPDERGAHVKGFNTGSIGILLIGTDAFTIPAWNSLRTLAHTLNRTHGERTWLGHRDASPDTDGDGEVEQHEWLKICPGFDVTDWWLRHKMQPVPGHICEVVL